MARRRFSLQRLLLLLVALVALFLLLEMNRWLPGGWPGGGGTEGFRTAPLDAKGDPDRVRPPSEPHPPPDWPPRDGIRVEVRTAGGERAAGALVGAGSSAPGAAASDGTTTLPWGPPLKDGFRVEAGDRRVTHRAGREIPAREWVVFLPAATPPAAPRATPPPRAIRTRLVDADGGPLPPATVRQVREGARTPLAVGRDGSLSLTVAETDVAATWLEIRVEGRPVLAVPVEGLPAEVPVPAGRTIAVRVLDPNGARPAGATVTARYAASSPGPGSAEPIEASATEQAGDDGIARLAVPAGRGVEILAEGLRHAPAARRLSAVDGTDTVDMVLPAGIQVPVRVLLEDGSPAVGAEVIANAALEGVRVTRTALTGKDGVARVGPLAAGPVEIYAKAAAHAWAATTVTASSAMGTTEVRLVRGRDLTLVVESPEGTPLPDVRVRLAPEGGGAPDVTPPGAAPLATDAKGMIVVRDLPDRPFTVRLSTPGYQPERLPSVRPGPTTWFATLVPD